jgi:Na+/melibiose symporter-like transporter
MIYSLAVLHPRARTFFGDEKRFEDFITHLAARARWMVLSGCFLIAFTGGVLMLLSPHNYRPTTWNAFMLIKAILLFLAILLFCFVSWKMWPARIMCAPEEISKFQKQFRIIAITLLLLIGTATVLGVVSSHLR